jgi:hypothetical protein
MDEDPNHLRWLWDLAVLIGGIESLVMGKREKLDFMW